MPSRTQDTTTPQVVHVATAEPPDPLAGTPYERRAVDLQRLAGGCSAFTYRVRLGRPEPASEDASAIVKVFTATLAFSTRIELGSERMLVECAALKALGGRREIHSNVSVEAPQLLFERSGELNVMGMSDAGPLPSLRDWFGSGVYQALQPQQRLDVIRMVGTALAHYISNIQTSSNAAGSACAQLKDQILAMGDNHVMKTFISRTYYGTGLEQSVPRAEATILNVLRQAAREGEEETMTSHEMLLHGDFSPRNILIEASNVNDVKVYVVDWESCRTGAPAFDVGLFAAEALWLQEYHDSAGGHALLASFLQSFGVHISPEGRVELSPQPQAGVCPIKIACRMASHLPTVATSFAFSHLRQGDPSRLHQARQRTEALKHWAIEVLRCSQLPDARDQVAALLGKLVPSAN